MGQILSSSSSSSHQRQHQQPHQQQPQQPHQQQQQQQQQRQPPSQKAPATATGANRLQVVFFPDANLVCKFWLEQGACRHGASCKFAHTQTGLATLLKALHSARATLDVCVFTITCDQISDALIEAHKRGVKVRVISDNDQKDTLGSDIHRMAQAGIPTRTDAEASHMHHKFAIVDNSLVLNGSFNWTRQAVLQNQENVVISDDPRLSHAFAAQFESLWQKYARNLVKN
ncbi:phospholipase D6 [Capsaspora owczarzaki ATCC 30864]|uniref:Mitochondrial cardiolipin hydrolase n=1 Tax=Capsaspora owczarzaki (strain ATCC 30864) TaxID=595528 RepID=A0A0D2VS02_CAPO3|nr:phospholipase D6 [Capsaspora owczarzaki ATCC 30864]KJE93767.1 phospholipase D6 [Capsaspora owczarzaki ATCC 30864]|eukprot:XP_004347261.1 phospholipase D6 [Capsaspora owczarzaki ATCC 30864]